MKIEPNAKLAPLYEDLIKIVGAAFLLSTAFKRWLVKVDMVDMWKFVNMEVEEKNRYALLTDIDGYNARCTLTLLINNLSLVSNKNWTR